MFQKKCFEFCWWDYSRAVKIEKSVSYNRSLTVHGTERWETKITLPALVFDQLLLAIHNGTVRPRFLVSRLHSRVTWGKAH